MANSVAQLNKEENKEMMAIWPDVVRDITEMVRNLNIPNVAKWMEKVLQYNVPKGKKLRGITLINVYKSLVPNDQLTEDNIRLVRILGWCVELMQAYILVLDDIQDHSLVRRGQPCWYRYNNIGEAAVNDGVLLESAMYYILRKHFQGKESYGNLVDTFQDVIFKTLMGQCLDLYSTNFGKKPNLDLFTMDQFNSLSKLKTAYYTHVLPAFAAMHFAGIKDPEMFRQARTILLEIGYLHQVRNDYEDCFGDSEVCGKDSTDIQEGKCTWLIVVALQRATPEQRKILEECYGIADPEKVRRVEELFIDLGLPKIYSIFKEEKYNMINARMQQISCGFLNSIFINLLGWVIAPQSGVNASPTL